MLWLLWCDGWYGVRLTLTLRVGVRREGLCRQLDHGATRRTTAALGSVKGGCECVCVCVVGGGGGGGGCLASSANGMQRPFV